MLAGEAIYMLPYMRKTFQTSMESVFQLSATQVGLLNSVFGVLALLCYFPGGWLADRFPARHLLTLSLLGTGLGGLYMATLPGSYPALLGVHAFWGVTSILTFWAALIKATRAWGGAHQQGISFGLLDGGRGLVGALLASAAVTVFAAAESVSAGLRGAILTYSLSCLAAALAVWVLAGNVAAAPGRLTQPQADQRWSLTRTLALPQVWLLAIVVVAAYMLYLGTFDFPAFAERGFDQSKTIGAMLGAFRDWLRPVAAVAAGMLADRVRATRTVGGAFVVVIAGFAALAAVPDQTAWFWLVIIQVAAVSIAVFALRGVYYALLEASAVPMVATGTAVGIVSVIGYTPDVFAHLLSGWFVDNFEGASGYRYYFTLLAGVGVVGLSANLALAFRHRHTVVAG